MTRGYAWLGMIIIMMEKCAGCIDGEGGSVMLVS